MFHLCTVARDTGARPSSGQRARAPAAQFVSDFSARGRYSPRMRREFCGVLLSALGFCGSAIGADFVVIDTNESGLGSLRQAIEDANAAPGADRIVFAIPGPGLHVIALYAEPLPAITGPVTIDGYTQPGTKPNTLALGTDAVLQIQVVSHLPVGPFAEPQIGLSVAANDSTIRGMIVTGFRESSFLGTRYSGVGISVSGARNVVEGNFVGTDGSADATLGNTIGMSVAGRHNRIGGGSAAASNVIGGNTTGVEVYAKLSNTAPTGEILIAGNQIGINPGPERGRC